jgi:hypothetical protein
MEFPEMVIDELKKKTAYEYLTDLANYSRKYGTSDADIVLIRLLDSYLQVKFGNAPPHVIEQKKKQKQQLFDQIKPLLETLISQERSMRSH